MSARKTHLDLSAFLLGGVSQLTDLENASWRVDNVSQDEKVLTSRHSKHVLTKRRLTIAASIMQAVVGARQTMLETSVYTIGGTDYLGDLKSGRMGIRTLADDGSAGKDEWTYPNALGTEISLQADHLVLAAATSSLMNTAGGSKSGLAVAVALTVGGYAFACPMLMTAVEKSIHGDKVVLMGVEFEQRGTPTISSGQTLLASIVSGSAILTYSLDDSVDTVAGNCLMMGCDLAFQDSQIVKDAFRFENQGTPTFG